MQNNDVELIGWYGGDRTHSQSAWCSTGTDLEKNKDRIPKLLNILAKENHGTPFEKSLLHFQVNTDVATHIQLLKHRIGVSINAESARYKEIKDDDFYVPCDWPEDMKEKLTEHTKKGLELYHNACETLTPILGRNRAKESSRFFRSYNTQLRSDISFNFRSFVHFYKLRSAPDSQKEIREIAVKMLELVKDIPGNPFQYSIKACIE
jgi:thymidylate synthase (FAD)